MAIFRQRAISREDIFLVFSACVFPVFVWSFYNLFYWMPGLLLRLNFSELAGAVAYILAFALLESVLFFLAISAVALAAALLIPARWLGQHLAVLGGALALLISIVAMLAQLNIPFLYVFSPKRLSFIALACLIYYALILRFPGFEGALKSLLRRLSVLSVIYVILGFLGLLVILIRNLPL